VILGDGLRNGGAETAASEEKAEENRSSSTKDSTGLIVGLVFLFLICIIIIIVIAVIMWRKKQADELAAAKDAPAAAITNDVYAQPPGAGPLDNPMYGVAGGATGSGYYATNADYAASNGVYAGVGPASGGEGYLDINPDAAGAMSASNPMYFTGAPSDGLYADAQLTPNVPPGQKPPNGYVDVAPQPRAGSMSKRPRIRPVPPTGAQWSQTGRRQSREWATRPTMLAETTALIGTVQARCKTRCT
jgi:hypothetical protein